MGNEHSKNIELLNKIGTIPELLENAKGIAANISSHEITVPGETTVQQNSKPFSLNLATESNDFVIVESDAAVVSQILETYSLLKEEVKENNADQTDVCLPASDPQTESTSSGEGAATATIAVHREDFECPRRKAEISTQTDKIIEADISTQTGEDDDDTATDTEGPVEEVIDMETAASKEDPLNVSACDIAEETANEEPVDNQAAVVINEEVVMKIIVYENIGFRTERVEATDNKKYDPEEEIMTGRDIAAEPDSNQKELIIEDEIVADKVITEDNGEGAGDMSVDVGLTETAEPQSTAVTPEAQEANGVPSSATTLMEEISEVVCEEPNPTPANQDVPGEERSVPLVTLLLVKVESAHEDTADDAVALIEELPEDTLSSVEDAVKPESVPEDCTADEKAEVGEDVKADARPERYEEGEPSPVFVDAELILEAAINALSREFESSNITPQETAMDNGFLVEEEVSTATTYAALSGEQEASIAIPEEQVETVADETNEDAVGALSNEVEAVPESVEDDATNVGEEPADVPPMDATEQPEPCVSVQEELKDENVAPAEVPTDSNHVVAEEPVEESSSLVDEVMKQIVEEIVTEDVAAECNFVASEEAENESSVKSTDSTADSQSVTRTDMEALAVRLQSACISVVEEPTHGPGGSTLSSLGYGITVTIHIAPKQEQQ